jgi:protein-tyrosine-phosphatase
MRILIVCTGNILRSVMAEYLLRSELPHIYVESAGCPCKRHG